MSPVSRPDPPYADDEIDLRELVGVLWRQKALIAAIGVIGAALGAGASLQSTKYVSEGLFLMPKAVIVTTPTTPQSLQSGGIEAQGVTPGAFKLEVQPVNLDAFKRYESALTNGHRLTEFVARTSAESERATDFLLQLAKKPEELNRSLQPEFGFTDKDAKAFGVKNPSADILIGIRLKHEAPVPTGGTPVLQLAEYVRDTVIRVELEGITLDQCTALRNREQELRNAQIANSFAIHQEEQRAATLRELITRNPEISAADNRQIVSVQKGNERFLSPMSQLVASEIAVSDMKLTEARNERERVAGSIKSDYYCKAQQALQQPISGKDFIGELGKIQETVFQNLDKSDDIVEQTWNEIDIERANWATTYLSSMRFVASPEGTEIQERKPGLKLGIVLGGLLGGMLGLFVALVRTWWKNEPDETVGRA